MPRRGAERSESACSTMLHPNRDELREFRREWDSEKPRSRKERREQRAICDEEGLSSERCFLGRYPHYPVCKRDTCEVSEAGIAVAVRVAKGWKLSDQAGAAKRARRVLREAKRAMDEMARRSQRNP